MTRMAPLRAPYAPDVQESFDRIMPPGAPPLVLFRTLAAHERAWTKFRAGSLLDRGPLSLRERELVIDRTCALAGCEYEWGVHIAAFAERARLDAEQVRATVIEGSDATCWTLPERALLRTVEALHASATLNDDCFADLAARYEPAQILEIILLCGFYRTVAFIANGLDLPLEPGAPRFADVADEPTGV